MFPVVCTSFISNAWLDFHEVYTCSVWKWHASKLSKETLAGKVRAFEVEAINIIVKQTIASSPGHAASCLVLSLALMIET